ncbi:MAG: ABC transporter ATP-binding protein [Deltaproteobacteria bacterium]|nr:ABC transporter ATP-binding protein [Deltaproteobacteria bacterium]
MTRSSPRAGPGGGAARDETPFVELRGIHKAFDGHAVLNGADLAVRRGEVLTILGGSGTGKSVMIKHMIGLLRPDRGSVWVEGEEVTRRSEREWFEVRRRFGYVFQGAALFDSLNVYENVAYPLREHLRWKEAAVAERVASRLDAVGLAGSEGKMPAELSGGMRKRVGVARAIALEPKVILYDEPTTGLDPANSRRIGEMIVNLQERLDVTSVVVTHELELCFAVSDRVVMLDGGRIVTGGEPEDFRRSDHPSVREFLGGGEMAATGSRAGIGEGRGRGAGHGQ